MATTAEQPRERFTNFTPYEMKKGEEYMSAEMLQHFKDLLLQWKQELMEEVDRTMHHMQEDAANYADPSDRATQEEEFSLEEYLEICKKDPTAYATRSAPDCDPVHRLQDSGRDSRTPDRHLSRTFNSCRPRAIPAPPAD